MHENVCRFIFCITSFEIILSKIDLYKMWDQMYYRRKATTYLHTLI